MRNGKKTPLFGGQLVNQGGPREARRQVINPSRSREKKKRGVEQSIFFSRRPNTPQKKTITEKV